MRPGAGGVGGGGNGYNTGRPGMSAPDAGRNTDVSKVAPAMGEVAKVSQTMAVSFRELGKYFAEVGTVLSTMTTTLRTFADALGSITESIGQRMGQGFDMLLGPLKGVADAAWSVVAPFQRITGALNPFLQALNPALANALQYAMRELIATFGLLVQPIARELVPVIKQVAASLQPVFRVLAPILGQMAKVLGDVIAILAESFAGVLKALVPYFEQGVRFFAALVEVLSPLIVVFGALLEALAPLMQVVAGALQTAFLWLAKGALYTTAALLKLFGATETLNKMIAAMKEGPGKERQESNGLQAAQNVQYTNAADFGRSLALAATLAAQTGTGKEDNRSMSDLTKEMLGQLENIRDNLTLASLREEIEKAVYAAGKKLMEGVGKPAFETGGQMAEDLLRDPLTFGIGRGLMRMIAPSIPGAGG